MIMYLSNFILINNNNFCIYNCAKTALVHLQQNNFLDCYSKNIDNYFVRY